MKTRTRVTWSNRTRRYQVQPLQYLIPESLSDLVKAEVICWEGLIIRMIFVIFGS